MLRAVQRYALSAIGADRPGIVAAMTRRLLEHGINIEDSQMTILGRHFTMTLLLAAESFDEARLRSELEDTGARIGLEAVTLKAVDESVGGRAEPSHIVSVYGADHPGIVHSVAAAIADMGVNVIDVATHLVEEEGEQPLYVMMMEIDLPPDVAPDRLDADLRAVAEREQLDVSVRAVEAEAL